ncbi:hypothetical protein [Facklamia hominis]|uniref:hypothetical protein n=1 Tax=Facklamia hominis TaxID=178214 RepID=UPI00288B1997|nr:hypothetical protein [Facklamia hominis]WPJ90108.1 hypothetical protein R0V13_06065 [Facklamia hominis]
MKKTLKKLTIISMSALTIAGTVPSLAVFAQEGESEASSSELIDSMTDEENLPSSLLQNSLEDLLEKFASENPKATIEKIVVKPLDKEDLADVVSDKVEDIIDEASKELDEESSESEVSSSEETNLTDEAADSQETVSDGEAGDENDLYQIAFLAKDGEGKAFVKSYQSDNLSPLPEKVTEKLTTLLEDGQSELGSAIEAASEKVDEAMDSSSEEADAGETSSEAEPEVQEGIQESSLAAFDEIKNKAEEIASYGQAREFIYSVNPETMATEVLVKVYENPQEPESGRQAEITLDAMSLEVIKAEGDLPETSEQAEGSQAVEEHSQEAAASSEKSTEPSEEKSSKKEAESKVVDEKKDESSKEEAKSDDKKEESKDSEKASEEKTANSKEESKMDDSKKDEKK